MENQLDKLITLMKAMHTHALQDMWETVAELDIERQQLLNSFSTNTSGLPASVLTAQVQTIRQIDQDIIQLAIESREKSASEHSQLKTQRSQCEEYRQTQC